jgi:antitoxin (DNA-binding transcriptional repressor) of toxin-antitoxin stability system
MEKRITATEMARTLSEVLNKVAYAGDEYIVERNGKAVCKVVPVKKKMTGRDLADFFRNGPKPDPGFKADVEYAIKNQPPLPDNKWR